MRNVSCTRSLPICCRCARTPHSADCSKQQSLWQLWYKATLLLSCTSLRTEGVFYCFFFSERLLCHPFGECRICWWGACINFRLLLTGSWAEVLDGLSEARAVSWWALASPCRVPEDPDSRGYTLSIVRRARACTFFLLSFFRQHTECII